MATVFAALEASGIERRDIQTSDLSLGAIWEPATATASSRRG